MNESEFLSTLLPSSPDFQPIVQAMRDKYSLPEVNPEGEPISEIYHLDKFVTLQEFRQEIEDLVRENLDFMPPDTAKLYRTSKAIVEQSNFDSFPELALVPESIKFPLEKLLGTIKDWMNVMYKILDAQLVRIANMLYTYILTGEADELPNDWFSKVATMTMSGDKMILAMASQLADPDIIVEQFRKEYRKQFGNHRPKITKTVKTTAYYIQRKRMGKPWNFVVEEFIRLNKFSLPRDRSNKRYFQTWHLYEQRLKKRMQRSEEILQVLVGDKKK